MRRVGMDQCSQALPTCQAIARIEHAHTARETDHRNRDYLCSLLQRSQSSASTLHLCRRCAH